MMKRLKLGLFVLLMFILVSSFASASVNLTDGLVSYWKFDEGTGTNAEDIVGVNNGTLINSPVWTTGLINDALYFNGVNTRVDLPNLNMHDKSITVSAWFYMNESATQTVQHIYNSGSGVTTNTVKKLTVSNNGLVSWGFYGNDLILTEGNFSKGTWVHIIADYDYSSGTGKIYLNGVEKGSRNFGSSRSTGNVFYMIGAGYDTVNSYNAFFNGKIDEVSIYNKVLNSTEIEALYNEGNGFQYPFITDNNFSISSTDYFSGFSVDNFNATFSQNNFTSTKSTSTGLISFFHNPDSFVSRWKLDDAIDANVTGGVKDTNELNNGTLFGKTFNHGTVSGGVTISPDGAMVFDGSTGFVNLSSLGALDNQEFTASFWINNTGTSADIQSVISAWNNNRQIIIGIRNDRRIVAGYRETIDNSMTVGGLPQDGLSLNTDYHIVYRLVKISPDNYTQEVYVNGVFIDSKEDGKTPNFTGDRLALGKRDSQTNSWYFKGTIKGQVYNRALTTDEITQIYNAGKDSYSPISDGLVFQASGKDFAGTTSSPTTIYDTNHLSASPVSWLNASMNFDGVNDYVDTGITNNSIFNGTEGFTLSAWINPLSGGGANLGRIADKSSGNAGQEGMLLGVRDTGLIAYRFGVGTTLNSASSVTFSTWSHISVKTYSNGTSSIYINGILSSTNNQNYLITTPNSLRIGARSGSNTDRNFQGSIADIRIFDYALSDMEINSLYTNSNLYNISINSDTSDTYISQQFNNHNLANNIVFNYSILNITSTEYDTYKVENFLTYYNKNLDSDQNLVYVDEGPLQFTINKNTDDSYIIQSHTLNLAQGLTNFLFNYSILNITSNIYNGLSINNFLVNYDRSISSGESFVYTNPGNIEFTINKDTNDTYIYQTHTLDLAQGITPFVFNYSIYNFTAINNRTSEQLQNFTATTRFQAKDYFAQAVAGVALLFFEPLERLFTINAPGYVLGYLNTSNDLGVTQYEAEIYASNSLLLNIYNASSGELVNVSLDIQFEFNDSLTNYNTSDGELFLTNLSVGEHRIIIFGDEMFQNSFYTITVGNNSFQRLDAFLQEKTTSETIFTIKDKDTGEAIEGAILTIKRYVNNDWVTINVLKSDVSGKVTFSYTPNVRYKFILSKSSYITREFELNPIIFGNYVVNLEKTTVTQTPEFQRITIAYKPQFFLNNKNNTIEFQFASFAGELEAYGFNATFNNTTVESAGYHSIGGTLIQDLLVSGGSFGDEVIINYWYILSGEEKVERQLRFYIGDASKGSLIDVGNHYGLGFYERTIIVTIVTLFVGGLAFVFGGVVSAGMGILIVMAYFIYTSFLTAWLLIPSMVLIGAVIAWSVKQ